MQHRVLFFGKIAGGVLVSCLADPYGADNEMRPEIDRCTGDDALIILGEALRFLEPLLAAR